VASPNALYCTYTLPAVLEVPRAVFAAVSSAYKLAVITLNVFVAELYLFNKYFAPALGIVVLTQTSPTDEPVGIDVCGE
jgi:hypothetical protein